MQYSNSKLLLNCYSTDNYAQLKLSGNGREIEGLVVVWMLLYPDVWTEMDTPDVTAGWTAASPIPGNMHIFQGSKGISQWPIN